jgi:hypothetical protein
MIPRNLLSSPHFHSPGEKKNWNHTEHNLGHVLTSSRNRLLKDRFLESWDGEGVQKKLDAIEERGERRWIGRS